jgi:hypothetical protein
MQVLSHPILEGREKEGLTPIISEYPIAKVVALQLEEAQVRPKW